MSSPALAPELAHGSGAPAPADHDDAGAATDAPQAVADPAPPFIHAGRYALPRAAGDLPGELVYTTRTADLQLWVMAPSSAGPWDWVITAAGKGAGGEVVDFETGFATRGECAENLGDYLDRTRIDPRPPPEDEMVEVDEGPAVVPPRARPELAPASRRVVGAPGPDGLEVTFALELAADVLRCVSERLEHNRRQR